MIRDLDALEDEIDRNSNKCLGLDPNIFFPIGHLTRRPKGHVGPWTIEEEEDYAISICLGLDGLPECPNLKECGEEAIARGESGGVWGGMKSSELKLKVRAHKKNVREISDER